MNNDLTISTLSFKLGFSDKAGSERRETSRGINLPEVMSIRHAPYTDSATKLPGIRSVLRFDRHLELSTGVIAPVSAYLVVAVPNDTGVTSADVVDVVKRIASTISSYDTGLSLDEEIFVNKEQ